jgi:hypothetical protein
MISASVPDSEAVLKLIISKDADVNLKSKIQVITTTHYLY